MKVYRTSDCKEFEKIVSEYTEECLAIHTSNTMCVWTGKLPTLNRAECKNLGLEIGQGEYLGGSIVNMAGDLTIGIITWGDSDIVLTIFQKIFSWLLDEKKVNVSQDNNDILADGKKVASWARATKKDGWCQSFIHFSIGEMNTELVDKICSKEMNKIPGSLCDYGIDSEMILEQINSIID